VINIYSMASRNTGARAGLNPARRAVVNRANVRRVIGPLDRSLFPPHPSRPFGFRPWRFRPCHGPGTVQRTFHHDYAAGYAVPRGLVGGEIQ
jgi:hypothetical protein